MIDLHCHSIFSDGTDDPETLARQAATLGLAALALTDHDTLAGLPRFLAVQPQVSTRLVPGLELSCRFAAWSSTSSASWWIPWTPPSRAGSTG